MPVAVVVIVLVVGVLDTGRDGDRGCGLGIEHAPEQQHEQRAAQWEQRDEPNQV